MNKGNNGFGFESDNGYDISSSSQGHKRHYEDIVSDTHKTVNSGNYDFVGMQSYEHHSHYRKKKRGLSGFLSDKYYKIKKWWRCMKKGKRAAIITLTSVILALIIAISWFFIYFRYNYYDMTEDPEELGFEEVIDKKIVNVALFGIDTREKNSFKGLSDSIMIMSLNTETKKVKIVSIMRDTLAPITQDGKTTYNKITTAYSKGGPELAVKTLNQCFGLDISEYATVNFYGMSDIIETVGGIDATLTDDEVKSRGENNHGINDMIQELCQYLGYNPNDYYVTRSGEQHLNGVQAVAYARIRYCINVWGTNNDYGRTDRQRYVMEQLFNKATQMSKKQYVKLAKALIPCSETSLSYSEILSLAFSILLKSPTFEQARIPQNEFLMPSPSGSFGSVVYYDLDYASKVIHGMFYDDISLEDFVAANGIEKNDWYAKIRGTSGSGAVTRPPASSADSTSHEEPESSAPDGAGSPDSSSDNSSSSSSSSGGTDSSGGSSDGSSSESTSSDDGGDTGEDIKPKETESKDDE